MKTITILNYVEGQVFTYQINESQIEECDDFLINEGHNPSNCEWMIH